MIKKLPFYNQEFSVKMQFQQSCVCVCGSLLKDMFLLI